MHLTLAVDEDAGLLGVEVGIFAIEDGGKETADEVVGREGGLAEDLLAEVVEDLRDVGRGGADVPAAAGGELVHLGNHLAQLEAPLLNGVDKDLRRAVFSDVRDHLRGRMPSRTRCEAPIVRPIKVGQKGVGVEDEALILVAHEEDGGHLNAGLLKEFEVVDHLDEDLGSLKGLGKGLVELVLAQQPEEEIAGIHVAIALTGVVKDRSARKEEEDSLLVAALNRPLVRRRS